MTENEIRGVNTRTRNPKRLSSVMVYSCDLRVLTLGGGGVNFGGGGVNFLHSIFSYCVRKGLHFTRGISFHPLKSVDSP